MAHAWWPGVVADSAASRRCADLHDHYSATPVPHVTAVLYPAIELTGRGTFGVLCLRSPDSAPELTNNEVFL